MKNKKIDIEMANMVGKTYLAIATWFNKDFDRDEDRQVALKSVSAEIIESILEDTFLQIDGAVDTKIKTEAKTVTKNVPVKTINQTSGGTGKMFAVNESAIVDAIRESK